MALVRIKSARVPDSLDREPWNRPPTPKYLTGILQWFDYILGSPHLAKRPWKLPCLLSEGTTFSINSIQFVDVSSPVGTLKVESKRNGGSRRWVLMQELMLLTPPLHDGLDAGTWDVPSKRRRFSMRGSREKVTCMPSMTGRCGEMNSLTDRRPFRLHSPVPRAGCFGQESRFPPLASIVGVLLVDQF